MTTAKPNPLAPVVYWFLMVLAFVVTLIIFGNQAGWWRVDF